MRFLNASVLPRMALNRNLSWGLPLGNLLPKTGVLKHRALERKRRPNVNTKRLTLVQPEDGLLRRPWGADLLRQNLFCYGLAKSLSLGTSAHLNFATELLHFTTDDTGLTTDDLGFDY